jgi:mannose/fructose/N-acetylgalactosamine-specific phosphotransferase system component IIC
MKLIINSYRRKCLENQIAFRILRHKLKNMKTVIKVLAGLILGFGLVQLTDLGLYLMNRSDSYLFNLGIVVLAIVGVAFAFLGLYLLKVLKPEDEEEKEENEL